LVVVEVGVEAALNMVAAFRVLDIQTQEIV
jgi:hypothetical protein